MITSSGSFRRTLLSYAHHAYVDWRVCTLYSVQLLRRAGISDYEVRLNLPPQFPASLSCRVRSKIFFFSSRTNVNICKLYCIQKLYLFYFSTDSLVCDTVRKNVIHFNGRMAEFASQEAFTKRRRLGQNMTIVYISACIRGAKRGGGGSQPPANLGTHPSFSHPLPHLQTILNWDSFVLRVFFLSLGASCAFWTHKRAPI